MDTADHKEVGVASRRLALLSEPPKQNEKTKSLTKWIASPKPVKQIRAMMGSDQKVAPKTKEQTPNNRPDSPRGSVRQEGLQELQGTGLCYRVRVSDDISAGWNTGWTLARLQSFHQAQRASLLKLLYLITFLSLHQCQLGTKDAGKETRPPFSSTPASGSEHCSCSWVCYWCSHTWTF